MDTTVRVVFSLLATPLVKILLFCLHSINKDWNRIRSYNGKTSNNPFNNYSTLMVLVYELNLTVSFRN